MTVHHLDLLSKSRIEHVAPNGITVAFEDRPDFIARVLLALDQFPDLFEQILWR